jgi:hypothetical protein
MVKLRWWLSSYAESSRKAAIYFRQLETNSKKTDGSS